MSEGGAGDPLGTLSARRVTEMVNEALVPLAASTSAWYVAKQFLAEPSAGRPLGRAELVVVLGGLAVLFAWYTGRQLTLLNVRRPATVAAWCLGTVATAIGTLSLFVSRAFASTCAELGGTVLETVPLLDRSTLVCRLGGVAENGYLPGAILRAPWDGHVPLWVGAVVAFLAVCAGVGLRLARVWPTRLGLHVVDTLRMAPAAGPKAIAEPGKEVQACGNPTLWGEPCGQLYGAEKVFEPGEWCHRCAQVYRRAERTLTFTVVSLYTADVDVLNGLERMDATAWPQGEPLPPDARLSGQERWVKLGKIEVPDVISVATLLQLVHARLKDWGSGDAPSPAFELAKTRASRLAAWVWFGRHDNRLTYARPTDRALLAVGPTRLRDLGLDVGEELTLQLDIGLVPLELRTGFRRTWLDRTREATLQNSRQDLWVPVVGRQPPADGLWVPRIEGAALRVWLSLDRLHADEVRGVTSPRPYVPVGQAPSAAPVPAGSLDLVRQPLVGNEPAMERVAGDSIAEWDWMDPRNLELLRQQALVMVTT